jgi:hypothetical protein
MDRIIAANGKTIYAKNEELYTVMAGDDGNDYIVETTNTNENKWHIYMPPEEPEDELICYEGPILALPNVKLEKTKNPTEHAEPMKFLPPPKKKTLVFKPTAESQKLQNVLQKENYETPKKKVLKKKQVSPSLV